MPRFPFESVLQSRLRAGAADPSVALGRGIVGGIEQGLNVSNLIAPLIERKRRAKRLASFTESDAGAALGQQMGVEPEAVGFLAEQGLLQTVGPALIAAEQARTEVPEVDKRTLKAREIVRGEMSQFFQRDPKGFEKAFGDPGLTFIGAKQPDPLDPFLRKQLGGF